MKFQVDRNFAMEMDDDDPLKAYRGQFHIPKQKNGEDVLYLCGNSLGLQPKSVRAHIEQELTDWGNLGVEGHFHAKNPWVRYHEFLTEKLARLVGGRNPEVIAMNSLTVNLHLLMVSFYRPTTKRFKIVIEQSAFPSDQYAVQSQLKFHGFDPADGLIELTPRPGEDILRTEDIESLLQKEGDSIALILLGGVNYYSGQAFDMERITRAAHAKGCIVGYDLAHAAGNLVLKLHDWNVDFAAWCSYKYLNAGPGGIGACFVNEKHVTNPNLHRFAGWWGHDKTRRFLMEPDFRPIPTAEGWQLSNPPIFQLAALDASLKIFDEVGMERLREKSERLTGYLEFLIDQLGDSVVTIITPRDAKQRGCQLSLRIPKNGKTLFQKLSDSGVICDWREPDALRVAPVPLYNSFMDVFRFVEILKKIT